MGDTCITCGKKLTDPDECVNWVIRKQELDYLKGRLLMIHLDQLRKIFGTEPWTRENHWKHGESNG